MFKHIKKGRFLLIFVLLLISLSGCADRATDENDAGTSRSSFLLDTVISVTIYDPLEDDRIFTEVFEEISRLEKILSVDYPGSDLDRLWKNAGAEPIKVARETTEVLQKSIHYSELSGGLFDVTAGPLISLWDITGKGHYPTEEELRQTLPLIDYRKVNLSGDQAMLMETGMKASLGAIAKGYIADCVKVFLLERNVRHAIINLGGNVVTMGGKPDGASGGTDFLIGIQDPEGETGEFIGVVSCKNKSLVSSGIFERYFTYQGKQYHHILNPKTGFPEENDLLEVTVLSEESVDGDGLSTTVFLLGLEKGLALLESLPDTEGIFITKEHEVYMTSGLKGQFQLTGEKYRIVEN